MPSRTTKIKPSTLKPYEQVIGGPITQANSWRPGVITTVDESRLPPGAVILARNCMQTQDGVWSTRWGSANYGAAFTGPVTGFHGATVFNSDGTTTQYYFIVDNGTIKYAKDGGSWTSVTGHTVDQTNWTNITQYQNKLLFCNGVDAFGYVDLTTSPFSWVGFTGLSTPPTPTVGYGSSLTSTGGGQNALYYQVTAVNKVGESAPSGVAIASMAQNRNTWWNPQSSTSASNNTYVTLTWSQISGALAYNIYVADASTGQAYLLDSVQQPSSAGNVVYTDYGSAALNQFILIPVTDTTTAPKFSWVQLSDNRLWAIGDPANPQRLYWAGVGPQFALGFSPFVGGGWVDIVPGAQQKPYFVGQFRDGKGTPMTTVLTSEPTGYGSVWHCQITSSTIGNTVIAVPTLVQSMSTFGTTAPRSVVQTMQNVYYHSPGPAGFYSNGSVPTLFNVLATNEISYLIRPDVRSITLSMAKNITGVEFDKKIFWSVPYASSTNNRIFVYDLAKQNWNPYAFDFGVKHFIRYTDNNGTLHLLAIPTTGTQILEIGSSISGDKGAAFVSHLQTGLIHTSPDHIQFAQLRYVYYEFGSPQGKVDMIFAGSTKNTPLNQLASVAVTLGDVASNVGFSSYAFSTVPFSYDKLKPQLTSQLSDKRRILINKLVNNWEAEVYSDTVNTSWTLNQIVAKGMMIPTQDPSGWIVN